MVIDVVVAVVCNSSGRNSINKPQVVVSNEKVEVVIVLKAYKQ